MFKDKGKDVTQEDIYNECYPPTNSNTQDEKFETIAKWIYSECDTPISEIEWLLKVVYTAKEPKLTFEEAWEDVLNEIKRMEKENE